LIKLGIDLDNTVICYDKLIYDLAKKKYPDLNFTKSNISKESIKKKIIKFYGNNQWTELQGLIYGEKILKADLYDNFKEVIKELKNNFKIFIISHKTRYPVLGEKINLRNSAKNFLKNNKISFCENELIDQKRIYFAETKQEKIDIIKGQKIDIFIDDLDEILSELPKNIKKIHFSRKKKNFMNFYKWQDIYKDLLSKKRLMLKEKIEKKINKKIKILKKINSGTNNEIYLIQINLKKFILKVYKNTKHKISFSKDLFFLQNTKDTKQTPVVRYHDEKLRFIIMDYIRGKKLKKITFNDIKKLVLFIYKIQPKILNYEKIKDKKIKFATDKISNINDIFNDIKLRINKTDQILKLNNKNLELINIHLFLKKFFKKLKLKIKKLKININQKKYYCLSPSDFNVRNILISSKKHHFIDFEYSGIDNCFKLVLDFFSQPEIFIKEEKRKFMLIEFSKIFENLHKDFDDSLINLNNIKWFYIILNSKYDGDFGDYQILQSIKYFDKRIKNL